MKRINRSSVSIGIAVTSLFIALGGPAQAASLITGKDIKNNSITGADVKNSSLTGADVKNKSLTKADFRGSVRGKTGATGPAGKAGTNGATGPAGAAGAVGPRGLEGPSRWVLVNRSGTIEAQSGGFRIANAYPAGGAGEANVYIDSGDANLSNNGIVSTIALENQYSLKGATPALINGRNPGADVNPEFSGEITASKCAVGTGPNAVAGVIGAVACAPADTVANGGSGVAGSTNQNNYLVVSPRNSDGSFTVNDSVAGANDNTHKRFYVILSGPRD